MPEREVVCICENKLTIDTPDIIDLAEQKEVENKIMEGEFLTLTCDQCGNVLKPELPFLLIDEKRGIEIFFIP